MLTSRRFLHGVILWVPKSGVCCPTSTRTTSQSQLCCILGNTSSSRTHDGRFSYYNTVLDTDILLRTAPLLTEHLSLQQPTRSSNKWPQVTAAGCSTWPDNMSKLASSGALQSHRTQAEQTVMPPVHWRSELSRLHFNLFNLLYGITETFSPSVAPLAFNLLKTPHVTRFTAKGYRDRAATFNSAFQNGLKCLCKALHPPPRPGKATQRNILGIVLKTVERSRRTNTDSLLFVHPPMKVIC